MTTPNAEDREAERTSSASPAAAGSHGEAPDRGAIPTIHVREVRQGHMPGERYVRIHRPFHDTFREAGPDTLVAREETFEPRGKVGRLSSRVRRALIGAPLASSELIHERIPKTKALAVFSSDALSSSAYATEEILRVLVLAGAGALAGGRLTQRARIATGAAGYAVVLGYAAHLALAA